MWPSKPGKKGEFFGEFGKMNGHLEIVMFLDLNLRVLLKKSRPPVRELKQYCLEPSHGLTLLFGKANCLLLPNGKYYGRQIGRKSNSLAWCFGTNSCWHKNKFGLFNPTWSYDSLSTVLAVPRFSVYEVHSSSDVWLSRVCLMARIYASTALLSGSGGQHEWLG